MLVTFPTRKSWFEHELTQHRICHDLKCHLCSTRFTAENTLSEHFQLKHDLSQRHSKLLAASSRAKSSERVSAKEEQCPLCLQSEWSDQRKFVTHLGRHLEEIALSVLPREVDSDSDQRSDDCGTSEDTDAPRSPSCPRKLPKEHMQPWEDYLPSEQNLDSRAQSTENYYDRNSSRTAIGREQPKRDPLVLFSCGHPDCQSTNSRPSMELQEWK